MEEILFHPVLWTIIAVGLVTAIVASVVIGRKRSKEVEELDKMFPEGKLAGQNLEKIPVEKVRRYSMERERRKREREKEMPKRVRPKEGEKVFAEEDQEFILHPLRRKKGASSKEDLKQKPLRPRSNVSEQVNLNNTNPRLHQSQGAKSQTFSSKSETTEKTHTSKTQTTNRRDLHTRLKPSDQINEAEAYEGQTFSSKLKPFSKTGRSQQTETTQSGSSESPFPPRSKRNNQSSTVNQESAEEESTQTSFASRSSKYSVRKRKRFF